MRLKCNIFPILYIYSIKLWRYWGGGGISLVPRPSHVFQCCTWKEGWLGRLCDVMVMCGHYSWMRFEVCLLTHANVYMHCTVTCMLASQQSTAELPAKGARVWENYQQSDYRGSPGLIWCSRRISRWEPCCSSRSFWILNFKLWQRVGWHCYSRRLSCSFGR